METSTPSTRCSVVCKSWSSWEKLSLVYSREQSSKVPMNILAFYIYNNYIIPVTFFMYLTFKKKTKKDKKPPNTHRHAFNINQDTTMSNVSIDPV